MIAGQLEIQLMADIARLKQDMESAKTVVGGAMAQIEKSVGAARTAILGLAAGLAAGLSIRAFQQIIKGSIDSAAALNDLSIQTGATVEALSGLASVGKYSDVSAQQIAASMNMLAKNMAGATEESKGAGKALEALGINFDQFKKLSPEQQMQTVAKSMGQFEDGAGKAAVAMALYGKEGAKMLPFLKDLADLGGIQAKVTAEQAAAADNFSDNLTRLQGSGDAWKKELAAGMIPALNDAVQAFIDVTNGSGGLRDEVRKLSKDGSIAEWTRNAIAGLTYVADAAEGAWRVMKTVGMGLGGLAAAAVALVNRDWAGVKNVLSNLGDDLQKTWSDQTLGQRLRARMADIKKVGDVAQEAKPKLDFTNVLGKDGGSAGGGRAAASEYDRLIKSIREKISVQQLEMASDQALTDGQKEAAKIMEGLRSGTLTLTDAQKKNVTAALELLIAEEKGVETKKAMAKAVVSTCRGLPKG